MHNTILLLREEPERIYASITLLIPSLHRQAPPSLNACAKVSGRNRDSAAFSSTAVLEEEKNADDLIQGSENQTHDELDIASDSDTSSYSSGGEKDEFIVVKLAEIRQEVQCPICLGIIRNTRTVMECLHRFCRACIDKSMRLGNNECPACRTHCPSRRSLRDDQNYDAMISALYPDIDKYEEEELAFHEEDKAHNEQIQASIDQTFRRQAEALGKKRPLAKATAGASGRNQSFIEFERSEKPSSYGTQ